MASSGFIYPITVISSASTGTVTWTAPLSACVDDGNLTSALIGTSQAEVGTRLVINGVPTGAVYTVPLSATSGVVLATYGHARTIWGLPSIAASSINSSGFGLEYLARGMGGLSQGLLATNFGFDIPTGALIEGIEIQIERGWHGSGPGYIDVDYIAGKIHYNNDPKPNFKPGHTLLPLTKYGWGIPYDIGTQAQVDFGIECARDYGYTLELYDDLSIAKINASTGYVAQVIAAAEASGLPISYVVYRERTEPVPETMYCHLDGITGTVATRVVDNTHGLRLSTPITTTSTLEDVVVQSAVPSSLAATGYLVIETEKMKYSSYSGSAFVISERAAFSSSGATHAVSAVVFDRPVAVVSPEAPLSIFTNYVDVWKLPLAHLVATHPTLDISILLNGGERGLAILATAQNQWQQDPDVVLAAGGPSATLDDWFRYISTQKRVQENIIGDAYRAIVPLRKAYIFYTDDGSGVRYSLGETWKYWSWSYPEMQDISDLPSAQNYYAMVGGGDGSWGDTNTAINGWDFPYKMLNKKAQMIHEDDPLSYDWWAAGNINISQTNNGMPITWVSGDDVSINTLRVRSGQSYKCIQAAGSCSGTNAPVPWGNDWWTPVDDVPGSGYYNAISDYAHWMGFIKLCYTAGSVGGNVGYYNVPYNAYPAWRDQIRLHGHAHALFSHLEHFLREGSLLPGNGNHVWSTDYPSYEFTATSGNARVIARKLDHYNEWLITAFAVSGAILPTTITIPILGSVAVTARPEGSVYTAYKVNGVPLTTHLDTDPMLPSSGLVTRDSITLADPTFSPPASTYVGVQTVTIASTTGSTIYYTTDGSTPTTGSNLYDSAGVSVGYSQTIKALAVRYGDTQSAVTSAAYVIVGADLVQTNLVGSWDLALASTINLMTSGAADCDAGWDAATNGTRSYTTTGDASGRITLVTTAPSGYVRCQQTNLVANQNVYSAQVMVYSTSGTEQARLLLEFSDYGGGAAGGSTGPFTTISTSGTLLTRENVKCAYTGKQAKRAYLYVYLAGSGQCISFDKAQIEESATCSTWVSGCGDIQAASGVNGTSGTLQRGLTTSYEYSDPTLSKYGSVFVAVGSGSAQRMLPSTSNGWWNTKAQNSSGASFVVAINPTEPNVWASVGIIPVGTVVAYAGNNYICTRAHAYSTTYCPSGEASSGTWELKPKSVLFDFVNNGAATGDGSNSSFTAWINQNGTITVGAKSCSGDTLQTHTSSTVIAPISTWTLISASVDYAANTISIYKNGELFSINDKGTGKSFSKTGYTSGAATAKDLIGATSDGNSPVNSTILYSAFYSGSLPASSHAIIYDYLKYHASTDHEITLLGNPADTTPPSIAITYPTTAATYSCAVSSITLSGTSSDDRYVDHVTCFNGASSGVISGLESWSATASLVAGINNIVVSAYDLAGNEGTDTLEVTYTPPDTTAPAITITCPTVEATYSTAVSSVTLSGTASDAVGVDRVIWNLGISSGVCAGTTSWSVTSELVTGLNTFVIQAYDVAGNVGSDTIDITYEPTAPDAVSLIIGYPTSGLTYSTQLATITLSGTASGTSAISSVTYSYDTPSTDPELGNCSGNETWTLTHSLLEGLNTFIIYATSEAGGTGSGSIAVTYSLSDYTTRAQQKLIIKPFIINTSSINISSNPTTLLLANVYVGNSSTADTLELIDTRQRGGGLDPKLRLTTAQQEEAKTLWDISTWDGQPTITNGTVVIKIPSSSLIQNGGNFTYEQIEALVNKNAPVGILPLIEYV